MSKCYLKSKNWSCFLLNNYCQDKNKKWACIHELKCLFVFKQIEKNLFYDENLVKKLVKDNDFNHIGNIKKQVLKNLVNLVFNRKFTIYIIFQ